ncbi:MAG TPA: CBS domain-containing protein [Burkholderiales bacterium]|nr:CBS domain-containing protein [Burkholderiales bacterium]
MAIGEICNREVVYVNRDVTVHAACKLMRHYHVGSLVVVDEVNGKREPVGILTDRDVVVEIDAMDLDAKVITVGDIMSQALVTVPENHGVVETIEVMRVKGVRRVPVVDADNRLIGIVTIDDLLEVLAGELSDIARIVAREQSHEQQARR